jgi:hypothetical protein
MHLTARQREFAGIAGWALPVSVTLGAIFGHFNTPNDSGWGYIQKQGRVLGMVEPTAEIVNSREHFEKSSVPACLRLAWAGFSAPRMPWGDLAATRVPSYSDKRFKQS